MDTLENEQPFRFKIGANFPSPIDVGATYYNGSIRLDYARVNIMGQTLDVLNQLDPEVIFELKEHAENNYFLETTCDWNEE